jgi:hypothetical protein
VLWPFAFQGLNALHRINLEDVPLLPTMRRVLLDERDAVLTHALRSCPGACVVGVVGKAHVAGIRRRWGEAQATLDESVAEALQEPEVPLGRRLAPAAAAAMLPLAALGGYRSRVIRYSVGTVVLGFGAGAAWLALAVRRRLRHFEETSMRGGAERGDD